MAKALTDRRIKSSDVPVHRTLVLVRHGEFTQSSLGLTQRGRRQAARAAQRLRQLPVMKIHCSSMKRAYETALIIAKCLPGRSLVRTHLLRECLPSLPRHRRKSSPGVTPEMIRRGKEQVDRAYRRYFQPPSRRDQCHVLVSHGNVIRYLVGRVLGLGKYGWYRMGTSHCGITVIRISREGRLVLDVYNDTGHLPRKMTTSGTKLER